MYNAKQANLNWRPSETETVRLFDAPCCLRGFGFWVAERVGFI